MHTETWIRQSSLDWIISKRWSDLGLASIRISIGGYIPTSRAFSIILSCILWGSLGLRACQLMLVSRYLTKTKLLCLAIADSCQPVTH
jgi:hypothetical protein